MTSEQRPVRRQDTSPSRWPGFTDLGPTHLIVRMAAVALLLLVTGLAGGMVLERYVVSGESDTQVAFPDLEAVSDVIDQNYYYRPVSPDDARQLDREMEQQAIIGALSTLNDDYTRYLSADQSATAQEDLEGRYGGTGVDVAIHNSLLVVTNVVPDSPADAAGILRGDVIDRIDDQPVDITDFEGMVRELRGDVGSVVRLAMARPSTAAEFVIELTREEIVVPPVTLRMIDGTTIGWLRITIFGDETVAEVDEAIRTLQRNGASGIVLDLRGNGGGWVTSAQGVLGRFLDPNVGPAMYEDTSPGRGGEQPLPILREEGSAHTELPIVVLVDSGTASAAEIVAGAMKDYDRAIVAGEPTFGKGSVQRIFAFSDGATLRVTVAEWFTPSRGRIQQEGIQPNVEIEPGRPDETNRDHMLDGAVGLIESGTTRPTDLIYAPPSPVATPQASPAG